ncbi:uncharacterized protein si:dkeyp-75h12.7 isoform X2 [Onychostoma macrolepis]|uniref:Fibronectin type-III domain-containing protein n=1 Tax=Onychostoma macrolepis TaxID=369639 RepID=A0A7J6CVC9_9TELE|nr:uncharacterized protein si:dkeyp-75h12.7 isoform X2 [Onychostoma macrolepis]KAF4111289.1 hypothetical protein G5714_008320 [Onychostoma macrolepis]
MPVALLNLCFSLLVLNIESAVSVCNIRVHTINFGCHLEWDCPDASPKTTYTVLSKTHGTSWINVSGCIQISQQSCDLSHVFPNLNSYNFIRLTSESLWINETWECDPINDSAAKFSPPSITISMDNGSLWVTVNFPCSPSISCSNDVGYYEEEEEMGSSCPLTEFKSLQATVTLYNKQNISDRQAHTAEVLDETPFKVEFGFLTPGHVYCAVANFTVEGVLASSPPSIPQCVYIPVNNESLIVVVVCAVLITLGLVFFLVWRQRAPSERPLPRSLALLRDLELQNETFIDSSKVAPHNESSEGDHVSVVSFSDFTLLDNQSSYYNTQSLGNGYYTNPILHNPDCTEESAEYEELCTEVQHDEFHLLPSHPILETEVACPYQNQNNFPSLRDIPLSSVRVEHTQQDETSTEAPERSEDVMWGKLNMRPIEDFQAN